MKKTMSKKKTMEKKTRDILQAASGSDETRFKVEVGEQVND